MGDLFLANACIDGTFSYNMSIKRFDSWISVLIPYELHRAVVGNGQYHICNLWDLAEILPKLDRRVQ